MKNRYSSFKTTKEIDGIGICVTYGIKYCDEDGTSTVISDDVSSDSETAEQVVSVLNRENASDVHAFDIICDMI